MTKIQYIKMDERILNITKAYETDICYDIRANTPLEDIIIEPH